MLQADDLHSRYLLTFASASVANEWWSLIQTHFPETTRPGPQLFSFQADDLLGKAWKHAAFAQLKPKWMYIQFDGSTGGAAQGIIPVQDSKGNLLGGASGSSEQQYRREARKEAKSEVGMLEERFEKMMEAVERNTEQISALTAAKSSGSSAVVDTGRESLNGDANQPEAPGLSTHLDRISQLLEQNSAHVAQLTQRQTENEKRMRQIIEKQSQPQNSSAPDMGQLTSHLDRIQRLMERNTHGRKDSARDIRTSPPRIDLSPLTFWLEKVLGAVEQNSELVKELLQDSEGSKRSLHAQQIDLDLSPLSQRLDDLIDAQEAKASRDQDVSTQLIQRLDKVVETQHKAVERGPFDVSLLSQRLDEILTVHRHAATTPLLEKMDELVESHKSADVSHVSQHLEDLVAETATLRDAIDYSPLAEPLGAIRTATEQNNEHLMSLIEAQQQREYQHTHDMETQADHLEALRATTEQNSATMTELLDSLATNRHVMNETSSTALTPFDEQVSASAERQNEGPGIGDSKFIISALTSHLSKIQAVTESNANAVRSAREGNHALQKNVTSAVSETSAHLRALATKHKDFAAQMAVREGQVREVVRSQAEMVECVRELAKTIKAHEKDTCNHVVIPPPRKTNRKVVGFVYDAKDGKT